MSSKLYIKQKLIFRSTVHPISSQELQIKCKLAINFWDKAQEQYTNQAYFINHLCVLSRSTQGIQNETCLSLHTFSFHLRKNNSQWEPEGKCNHHQPAWMTRTPNLWSMLLKSRSCVTYSAMDTWLMGIQPADRYMRSQNCHLNKLAWGSWFDGMS